MERGPQSQTVKTVYAGFWLRLAAALVDGLVLFIPTATAAFVLVVAGKLLRYDAALVNIFGPLIATISVSFLYFVFMESSKLQATLGKIVVGICVTDLEGNRVSVGRATGRMLAKYISNATLGLGYILCGVTGKKQALHDIVAKCLVLRRPR